MSLVKVSVIVPVYNVEPYLRRSMDCLMNQTMKDLEFICIDDCSTDNSLAILREYGAKDSRFKIITSDKNNGVAVARNRGLEVAVGEYIGFVDPDDAIDLNYYEELYKKAKEKDCDIVKCQMKRITADGNVKLGSATKIIEKYGLYGFRFEWTAAIYKSSLIFENNIKFKPELIHAEDTLFLTEVILKSKTIAINHNVFYYYYRREGSLFSKKLSAPKLKSALCAIRFSLDAINNAKISKIISKKDYNMYYPRRYKDILKTFYRATDKENRLLCAEEIIGCFYLCTDTGDFEKNYQYKKLLKYIKNKDAKGLEKFMSQYKNLSDLKEEEIKIIEKIFSVKNLPDKKGKVIRILGVKIKFTTSERNKSIKRLHYYKFDSNFGDRLNILLFKYLNVEIIYGDKQKAEISAIGSVLESFITNRMYIGTKLFKKPVIIYGSGFIQEKTKKDYCVRRLDVRAVRGRITFNRLKKMNFVKFAKNVALGDPGLLVSKFVDTSKVEKKYDLGIIPHYVDKDNQLLNKIHVKNSVILDVCSNPEDLIIKIAECRNIISSAMHGLIAADSLGIPNVRMILSDKIVGGDYKFNDYYSAFGLSKHERINLNERSFADDDLPKIAENYKITHGMVEKIQQELIDAFPYKNMKKGTK